MTRDYLTPREFAAAVHASDDTVRRWIVGGRLAAYRLGGRGSTYRIPPGEVDRFLAAAERWTPDGEAAVVVAHEHVA